MDEDEFPEWMNYGDDQILELLQSEDVFTPDQVAEEVPIRGPEVAVRCRELANHGLLEKTAIGMYEVTELGERFLAGEVESAELAADAGGDGDHDADDSDDGQEDDAPDADSDDD